MGDFLLHIIVIRESNPRLKACGPGECFADKVVRGFVYAVLPRFGNLKTSVHLVGELTLVPEITAIIIS